MGTTTPQVKTAVIPRMTRTELLTLDQEAMMSKDDPVSHGGMKLNYEIHE
jgi:hypothetical protein